MQFDVIIIGGGPGGYVAAIRASQLNLKVALIEHKHLGGICLNWGCIPTKALLKASEIYHTAQHANDFGITFKDVTFDFKSVIERSRKISNQLTSGIEYLLKKNNIKVINGYAKLINSKSVSVKMNDRDIELNCKYIILATGAKAKTVPSIEPDGKLIWSYKEALIPNALPKSIAIIGSGAIGIELASFYNMFGVNISILEMRSRILYNEDSEISAFAHKSFNKRGINIYTNASIKDVKKNSNDVKINYTVDSKEHSIKVERIISAVGITPNTEDIGLENTKIKLDKGFVKTNKYLETDEKDIYAIGDITSAPWLAHKATHEAIICIEKIAGLKVHSLESINIPSCVYCYPQIASIGLTEENAKAQGIKIRVGHFPYVANGKAVASNETEGFVKTIFCVESGELIGAHIIGAEATEMIHSFALLKSMEGTEQDIINTIFPHPTLSEMIHESTLDAFKRALHI